MIVHELIASRVVIAGPDGRPRIELGLVNGEPAIRIFDAEGAERIRLGLERDVDPEPVHAGLVAELRMTATDDGGEVTLTAAHSNYAAIDISSLAGERKGAAAGAWIEANGESLQALAHGSDGGKTFTWNG